MPQSVTITVNSHWIRKQVAIEVIVTRVSLGRMTYITRDRTGSGTLPHWLFLQDFQPVTEGKKKKTRWSLIAPGADR
jgi:hypothetical protein